MRVAILHVHDATGAWTETYSEGDARSTFQAGDDIQQWATVLIDRYNTTLRENDQPRTLDRVEVVDDAAPSTPIWHDWHKTNAVTVSDQRGTYDALRCERCGITAKRFGLANVRLDPPYNRVKAFQTCRGAQALLARRKAQAT